MGTTREGIAGGGAITINDIDDVGFVGLAVDQSATHFDRCREFSAARFFAIANILVNQALTVIQYRPAIAAILLKPIIWQRPRILPYTIRSRKGKMEIPVS
jgi:hypothetical protein